MTTTSVTHRGRDTRVIAGRGYMPHVRGKALIKVTDTGNGYIAHAPSFTSTQQDQYLCMDYSTAHDLWQALSAIYAKEKP